MHILIFGGDRMLEHRLRANHKVWVTLREWLEKHIGVIKQLCEASGPLVRIVIDSLLLQRMIRLCTSSGAQGVTSLLI